MVLRVGVVEGLLDGGGLLLVVDEEDHLHRGGRLVRGVEAGRGLERVLEVGHHVGEELVGLHGVGRHLHAAGLVGDEEGAQAVAEEVLVHRLVRRHVHLALHDVPGVEGDVLDADVQVLAHGALRKEGRARLVLEALVSVGAGHVAALAAQRAVLHVVRVHAQHGAVLLAEGLQAVQRLGRELFVCWWPFVWIGSGQLGGLGEGLAVCRVMHALGGWGRGTTV